MNSYYKVQTVQTHYGTLTYDEYDEPIIDDESIVEMEKPLIKEIGKINRLDDAIVLAKHVENEIFNFSNGTFSKANPVVEIIKCTYEEEKLDATTWHKE